MDYTQILSTVLSVAPDSWKPWIMFVLSLIGSFSVLAAVLPPATEGKVWAVIRGVIDFCAANIGNAKNAPTEQK